MEKTVAARLFVDETRSFGQLYHDADWTAPVPTCGDWTAVQLFRHVGRGKRWAAKIVADRSSEPVDPRSVPEGKPPDDPDGAIDWLNAGAQKLVDAVEVTGAEVPVWTFNGPRPSSWWVRRRLHEVLVHRADAALAFGVDFDVTPELAADSLTEWLELQAENPRASTPIDVGNSVHLHATDDGLGALGEWTISGTPDGGVSWSHDHGKGSVAVRGPARELLLVTTRRLGLDDAEVELFGDRAVWDSWLERTPF